MKVKDVIKQLQKCDPNATAIVASSNFELKGSDVPVSYLSQSEEGSKRVETFRDAFDGEAYNKTIWSTVGGKSKVVKIS